MLEMFVGALVIAALLRSVPGAIADLIVANRAARAGQWDVIDRERDRRSARAARRARLAMLLARRRGTAPNPDRRPGFGDLVGEVYHGLCEQALERLRTRRGGRPAPPVQEQVERRLEQGATRPADPLDRRCPDCGAPLTDTGNGWAHPHGRPCAATGGEYQPARTRPTRERCGRTDPHPSHQFMSITGYTDNVCPGIRAPIGPVADPSDEDPDERTGPEMTAPVEEVQTNEAARRAFDQMAAAAAKLAEAAALAEQALAEIKGVAGATADGMAAVRFDEGATAACAEVVDAVDVDTLSRWSEVADNVTSAAKAGKAALEKYRDAEDVVADNNVDGRTLEPSQS